MELIKGSRKYLLLIILTMLIVVSTTGCGPSTKELAEVDYAPVTGLDWEVSTPEEEGLDPELVAELYYDAAKLDSIYSLLIVKNDYLVSEKYFNEGSIDLKSNIQSMTKSYISALVGIAIDQGCLTSVDQPFLDFFPEYADQIDDSRKEQITVRHLLQMRSGYPWEESHNDFWNGLLTFDYRDLMVQYPLVTDPGTRFHYSNASSDWLGMIVSRSCGVDHREFAEANLFTPIGAELGEWWETEVNEFPKGSCCMHVSSRDLAKFGLLYLNDGEFDGKQVISSDWVQDSLQAYSTGKQIEYLPQSGPNFIRTGYGYQWWKIQSGEHEYDAALGHGGQVMALLDDLDMVVLVTGDPFWLADGWKYEKQLKNLVADFIASLPSD